jgi:hypothetical protein
VRAERLRRRPECAARPPRAELGIGNRARVAIRKAEVLARARRMVQRVGRCIVAEPVAAVAREPQLAVRGSQSKPTLLRMPRANVSRPEPSAFIRMMLA